MSEDLDYIIRLSVYLFELVVFVIITRKLFWEKYSFWKVVCCALLSPVTGVLLFNTVAVDVLEEFSVTSSSGYLAIYGSCFVLIQTVGLLLFLGGYVKLTKAKNPSIAMFVFLSFSLMVPNVMINFTLQRPIIAVALQVILVILFYVILIPPLAKMTKERVTTNLKLFIILPALTTLYNMVTLAISMIILFKAALVEDDISYIASLLKEIITEENTEVLKEKMHSIFDTSIGNVPDVLFYSVCFVTLILIIAFAVIIQNIQYLNETLKAKEQLKELNREVMEALARTIDAKDMYTKGHSMRVAKYARMIAEKMGLSEERQESVYYMGLLHDIGKIAVPNEIINKKSKLTDEEFGIVKVHTNMGYEILAEIKSRPDLAFGAEYHHERVDGKGYPEHLKGDEIPIEARIIAVADSYDAMTSNRSYRDLLPQEKVRSELLKNIGTQFDEKPAKCMVAIMDEDKEYQLHE